MSDPKYKFKNIFDDLGIGNLPAEEQEKFFAEMQEVVGMGVIAKISKMLSEEEKKKFEAMTSDEEKEKFLSEKGINLNAIALEEATSFRERLLADVNYIAGRVEQKKKDQSGN
ncbi:hypothetical protein KKG51_05135 [Patescibacteria group bacterium]|nr:hypothetical protein [Patescibacteria group bacterium]